MVAKSLKLFLPISKVIEETREVFGYAAEEAPDRTGEILDYLRSKPYFEEWSESQRTASAGKSLGNVRAMHGKVAAGVVQHLEFQDAEKKIFVGTKIVDEAEWAKVSSGTYTGFSIGGEYVERKKDGEFLRYVARPHEISLVDRPAMPGATFTIVKADGSEEERKAIGREVRQVWTCGTPSHEHLAKADAISCDGALKKSMYSVGDLANAINTLNSVRLSVAADATWRGMDTDVPGQLAEQESVLVEVLRQLLDEEAEQMLADMRADAREMKQATVLLEEISGSLKKGSTAEDHMDEKQFEKLATGLSESIGKSIGEKFDALSKSVTDSVGSLTAKVGDLEKKAAEQDKAIEGVLEVLVGTLAPTDVTLRTVEKADDAPTTGGDAEDVELEKAIAAATDPDAKRRLEVKKALRHPKPPPRFELARRADAGVL